MEALGFAYLAAAIFLIIAAILFIFLPFFVLRIRNELISANQKLSIIVNTIPAEKIVLPPDDPGFWRDVQSRALETKATPADDAGFFEKHIMPRL